MRANRFKTRGVVMLLMTLGLIPIGAVSVASLDASTCAGRSATIVGTDADDVLVGTDSADVIVGLGGNDQIDPVSVMTCSAAATEVTGSLMQTASTTSTAAQVMTFCRMRAARRFSSAKAA